MGGNAVSLTITGHFNGRTAIGGKAAVKILQISWNSDRDRTGGNVPTFCRSAVIDARQKGGPLRHSYRVAIRTSRTNVLST
jgi:hypothetical protein